MDLVTLLRQALHRTHMLYREPVDIRYWLLLALADALASISLLINWPRAVIPGQSVWNLYAHSKGLLPAFLATTSTVAMGLLIWLGYVWLRSRGRVLLLELVATGKGEGDFSSIWSRIQPLASELFLIHAALDLGAMAIATAISALAVGTAFMMNANPSDPSYTVMLSIAGVIVMPLGIVWFSISWLIDEFALPVAWSRSVSIREGMTVLNVLWSTYHSDFFVYLLARIVLTLGSFLLSMAIAYAPFGVLRIFISTAVSIPLCVFLQSLPLALLFGVDPKGYRVFGAARATVSGT